MQCFYRLKRKLQEFLEPFDPDPLATRRNHAQHLLLAHLPKDICSIITNYIPLENTPKSWKLRKPLRDYITTNESCRFPNGISSIENRDIIGCICVNKHWISVYPYQVSMRTTPNSRPIIYEVSDIRSWILHPRGLVICTGDTCVVLDVETNRVIMEQKLPIKGDKYEWPIVIQNSDLYVAVRGYVLRISIGDFDIQFTVIKHRKHIWKLCATKYRVYVLSRGRNLSYIVNDTLSEILMSSKFHDICSDGELLAARSCREITWFNSNHERKIFPLPDDVNASLVSISGDFFVLCQNVNSIDESHYHFYQNDKLLYTHKLPIHYHLFNVLSNRRLLVHAAKFFYILQ